jgi:hypothetical protein
MNSPTAPGPTRQDKILRKDLKEDTRTERDLNLQAISETLADETELAVRYYGARGRGRGFSLDDFLRR